MESQINITFTYKLGKMCGLKANNLIYSLVSSIDGKSGLLESLCNHTLDKSPFIIDASLEIFGGEKTNISKKSYPYLNIKEKKENLLNILALSKDSLGLKDIKIGGDKIEAALAALSNTYLQTFVKPIQFFLPHSSVCSGQWDFWDKINYLELIEKIHQKGTAKLLTEKLLTSNVWKIKFQPDDFPEIVKRRLVKEKAFDKKLDPSALMKAIIIRMGELAKPSINYEVIDFSIRSFFTYLGVKQYLRVDREMLFLRRFEKEMMKILADIS